MSRNENFNLEKQNVIKSVNTQWEKLSISLIEKFIKHNKDTILNEEVRELIMNWCNVNSSRINFCTALSKENINKTTLSRNAEKLSFFIRKLELKNYPQSLYLDMLSSQRENDTEIEIFPFVESFISSDKIKNRVIQNIKDNIKFYVVLENHLKYCRENKIKEVLPFLLNYLASDTGVSRSDVLNTYIDLGGGEKELRQVLENIGDNFKFRVVEELIKLNSNNKWLIRYLKNTLKNTLNQEDKIAIIEYLVQLQDIEGLNLYFKFIQIEKRIPGNHSFASPLPFLHSIHSLPILLKLFVLSYNKTIIQDNFNNLYSSVTSALTKVLLFNNQFPKGKKKISTWMFMQRIINFVFRRKSIEYMNDLLFHLENIELQYYVNKGGELSLNDAISFANDREFYA